MKNTQYKWYDIQDEEDFNIGTLEEAKEWLVDFWAENNDDQYSEQELEEIIQNIQKATPSELNDKMGGIDWTLEDLTNYNAIKDALAMLSEATEEEANVLYQKIQDNFQTIHHDYSQAMPFEVYLIHDNIYFSKMTADLFDDGKDSPNKLYIILNPNETLTEGACYSYLYHSYESAQEAIEEEQS